MLTPEEIAVARSIEGQPWETKKPIYLESGCNRQTAPVKLPITLNLRAGAVDIQVYGGKIERCDDKGVLFVSESNDVRLVVRTPDIPTSQIKRVTVYAGVPRGGSEAMVSLELFFHTALYPESSAFCSAQLGPLRSSRASVSTVDIMGRDKFGAPLTALRIDPGQQPGARVLLRRIRIE